MLFFPPQGTRVRFRWFLLSLFSYFVNENNHVLYNIIRKKIKNFIVEGENLLNKNGKRERKVYTLSVLQGQNIIHSFLDSGCSALLYFEHVY